MGHLLNTAVRLLGVVICCFFVGTFGSLLLAGVVLYVVFRSFGGRKC